MDPCAARHPACVNPFHLGRGRAKKGQVQCSLAGIGVREILTASAGRWVCGLQPGKRSQGTSQRQDPLFTEVVDSGRFPAPARLDGFCHRDGYRKRRRSSPREDGELESEGGVL